MTADATTTKPPWRVLTWNLHGSALPDLGLAARVLQRADPDIVALQEVRHRQANTLAATLGWDHAWVFKHNGYWPMWWRAEGLAILSRSPLDDVWRAALSHRVSRRSHRRRVAIGATIRRDPGDAVHLVDTHLATDPPAERVTQAGRLLGHVRDDARPLVVAGDLNARDEVELLRVFGPVGLVDPGGADTSPAVAPVQRIDYVLVPQTAEILDRRTPPGGPDWAKLSDHLPTLVEIRLR